MSVVKDKDGRLRWQNFGEEAVNLDEQSWQDMQQIRDSGLNISEVVALDDERVVPKRFRTLEASSKFTINPQHASLYWLLVSNSCILHSLDLVYGPPYDHSRSYVGRIS